jgi:hypothetical protein
MSGLAARRLCEWIARAMSSLPVPVAPLISTVASVCATRPILSSTASSAGDRPMISSMLWTDLISSCKYWFCCWSRAFSYSISTRSVMSTITVRDGDQLIIARESFLDPAGMMAQPPAHNVLARGPGQVVLDVVAQFSLPPVRQCPDPSLFVGELGDEGTVHADCRGQVPDERLEENLARASRRPLDDRPESGSFVVGRRRSDLRTVARHQHVLGRLDDPASDRLGFSLHKTIP